MTATQGIRLKYLYSPSGEANHPNEEVLSVYRDHGVIPKSSRSDNFNKTPENVERYLLVRPGDLVVNRMKAWQGSLGVSDYRGIVSGDYEVLRPISDSVSGRYMHYALRSRHMVGEYRVRSTGIRPSQWRLYWDKMGDIRITLPPLEGQERIADYLDHETAQIDTLITEQLRLVEMLRERRQAVIDHAFATLPGERIQLRRFIRFLTSGSRGWGEYYADSGDVFVRIGNLPRGSLSLGGEVQHVNLPPTVHEGQRTKLRIGDLLFSITAYIGSVAVVDQEWADSYVSQHVALCRINQSVLDPHFTGYFMLTTEGQDQLSEGAFGGTKVQLALDDIRALRIPVPTREVQRQIAEHLDRETSRIDTLIAESERLVELSQERRAALITAAVTGQIDISQES
ncbi:restriction endonuclease subunit S [Streptomyces sp. NPDC047880]|uniref:restriction endonuclease subunit S n=1 Tax=Streptomyces sp. NPDC047880 TaxID=3155626 RepID=UPI003452629F